MAFVEALLCLLFVNILANDSWIELFVKTLTFKQILIFLERICFYWKHDSKPVVPNLLALQADAELMGHILNGVGAQGWSAFLIQCTGLALCTRFDYGMIPRTGSICGATLCTGSGCGHVVAVREWWQG